MTLWDLLWLSFGALSGVGIAVGAAALPALVRWYRSATTQATKRESQNRRLLIDRRGRRSDRRGVLVLPQLRGVASATGEHRATPQTTTASDALARLLHG
jgi:hypothetical protein